MIHSPVVYAYLLVTLRLISSCTHCPHSYSSPLCYYSPFSQLMLLSLLRSNEWILSLIARHTSTWGLVTDWIRRLPGNWKAAVQIPSRVTKLHYFFNFHDDLTSYLEHLCSSVHFICSPCWICMNINIIIYILLYIHIYKIKLRY